MSDAPPEPEPTSEPPAPPAPDLTLAELKRQLDAVTAESRKWEQRAKTNDEKAKAAGAAAQELERLKRDQMSEHEKAVAAAKAEGAAEAKRALGGELVSMALRAAAAGRLDDSVVSKLAGSVNADLFLSDDGTVNMDEVSGFVDGLVPPPAPEPPPDPRFPDIAGQGRTAVALNDDNQLLSVFEQIGRQQQQLH